VTHAQSSGEVSVFFPKHKHRTTDLNHKN